VTLFFWVTVVIMQRWSSMGERSSREEALRKAAESAATASSPASSAAGIIWEPKGLVMHIISRKTLREFWEGHPESQSPLSRWYTIVRKTDFKDFNELRTTFPNADWVGGLIVFNIGGNKYRLIASIHFNRARVYVRHVLTHEEYGQGAWKP
jgi:mRNA interferase HigB